MKIKLQTWTIALALLLSACAPAVDSAAVATNAVQTVEARYTAEAALATPTFTPAPPPTLENTPTFAPTPTSLPAVNGQPQKPCYLAQFMGETVADGKIYTPGSVFTKTWTIANLGGCAWDSSYKLTLVSGDAMTTATSIALPRVVNPGDTITLAVDMTAPTAEGVYTGYWRIATPFGGSFGVGEYDSSLIAQITVAVKPDNAFAVTNVVYQLERTPREGCLNGGATYTLTATVSVNGPGEVRYHWNQYPYDGAKPEGGKLNFPDAGKKVISWSWILKADAVQGVDRKIALYIDSPNNAEMEQVIFNWTCP
ncbi:MAG: hypothetical protein OHK0031_03410 [Anaerolineales bacterium]